MDPRFGIVGAQPGQNVGGPSALDILEELVAATGTAIMQNDFESFAGKFSLPLLVTTLSGERRLHNQEELEGSFVRVIEHYELSGVERMERTCISGEFFGAECVVGVHETRLYRENYLVQSPFRVRSILIFQSEEWKIRETNYSIDDSLRYIRALTE